MRDISAHCPHCGANFDLAQFNVDAALLHAVPQGDNSRLSKIECGAGEHAQRRQERNGTSDYCVGDGKFLPAQRLRKQLTS